MQTIIQNKLRDIQQREQVRILFAVESGSRAWGFPSPDSDYDVRFVYIRPQEAYLQLNPPRDVIEWQLDETLDINGWDLAKALRLLRKSNPTLLEWCHSPIVYFSHPLFEEFRQLAEKCFLSKPGLRHYLHMAQTNNREYLRAEEVPLKKYLYVLRPLLACRWILTRGTPPPMLFSELTAACLDEAMKPTVEKLLEQKIRTPEVKTGPRIEALNHFIEAELPLLESRINALPSEDPCHWEILNALFLRLLNGLWLQE